jgi:cell division protein FtsW (lipid II flippase)
MKDFDSLVGIWNEQKTTPVIDHKEVITHYKGSREKLSLKLMKEILIMLPALMMMVYLWFTISYSFWTSYLGLAIVAGCGVYFIVIQIINIKNIASSNTLFDKPQDHIRFIQKFRKSRYIQHTRNYKIYTFVLGFGLSLCFIEFFYKLNLALMIAFVVTILAWFIICYFYLMKIYVRKEEKRFNEMLEDLERLNEQFKDEV